MSFPFALLRCPPLSRPLPVKPERILSCAKLSLLPVQPDFGPADQTPFASLRLHCQVARVMSAAGQMGAQLQSVAPSLNVTKPLEDLDKLLSSTVEGISKDLEASLVGLGPPEEVIKGFVNPLARQLDDALGGLLKTMEGSSEGLPALLGGLPGEEFGLCLTSQCTCPMHAGVCQHGREPLAMCVRMHMVIFLQHGVTALNMSEHMHVLVLL